MTSTSESIARETYELEVEAPIWRCIAAARAEDRILYIVLTKGVPIEIDGTERRTGTTASVDSELTLLYRRRTGQVTGIAGFVPNPYFAGAAPIASIQPFSHQIQDIYPAAPFIGDTSSMRIRWLTRRARRCQTADSCSIRQRLRRTWR